MIRKGALVLLSVCMALLPSRATPQVGSAAGAVPVPVLEARRQRLLEALGGAPGILSSAGPRGEYAQDSDYRESNDFFYLTGLEAPGGWLVLNGGSGEEVVLYLPARSPGAERWTGPTLGSGEEARGLTGVNHVRSTDELEGDLARWSHGWKAEDTPFVNFGDPRLEGVLAALLPPETAPYRSLSPLLASLRLVKDKEELGRLRTAVDITSEAHREIWRLAEPGSTEYQIEAALEYVFRAQGAERVGFPSIVGSGPNGTILHYDENRRTLQSGDLVVVDIGAEFGYYTADLTRTFPANGRFTPRQRDLYDLVLGSWEAGLEAIRPGGSMAEVNAATRGFLEANSGDLCGPGSCAPFLIHGVSHWLGMDVHDVGDNRTPFAAGMILTLEPGLYLPEESLGIRIEDDVLVTETGHEVLSETLPRRWEEIEAVMSEGPRWVRPRLGGQNR